jgi:F420-non-reducing hydrogenase iron-sulfur subunit
MSEETQGKVAAPEKQGAWQPRITAFVCRWCTYAGADLAGTSRLKYPPQIRIIKLPCTGRIDALFILRAFAAGADGVLVSGCHPGDCHYTSGNYVARRRFTMLRELLDFVGLEPARLHFSWVSAAEGAKFVDVVKKVTDSVTALGPFKGFEPEKMTGPTIDLRKKGNGGTGAQAGAGGAAAKDAGKVDIAAMKADLESGAVKAILGTRPARRPGHMHPFWAKTAAGLAEFRFAPEMNQSLVTYLVRRLREDPQGAYGIVAGPRDLLAIEHLTAESQIDPARIKVYEQRVQLPDTKHKQAWEVYDVPSMDQPASVRWNFWSGQFERCLRCYACREDCPMCSCTRCVADKTRPRWIDSSSTPSGNWLWNVTRALHQAGRCVECGGCTEACPVGIPLGALGMHLNRVAERLWGQAEGEKGQRSPLVVFRVEDEAPFIM